MGGDNFQTFSDQSHVVLSQIERLWAEVEVPPAYVEVLRQGLTLPADAMTAPENEDGRNLLSIWRLPGLCCAVTGKTEQEAIFVTAAWLLLYAAAHILDDLEDGDLKFTPLASAGAGAVFNVSTGWIMSASYFLNKLEATGVDSQVAQTIRSDFYHTLLHMCAGQHADLTVSAPTVQQCWQIATLKSASFFALACRAGSRLASRDLRQIELIGQFGHHLGMLIQVSDDWGGLWPAAGERSDLVADAKWSLPIAYAMAVLEADEAARLQAHLQLAVRDEGAAIEARRLIIKSGSLFYLAVEAERHRQQAMTILETAMMSSPARQELRALLNTLIPLRTT